MKASERFKIQSRLTQIERDRLVYLNGKLSYRELIPSEQAEKKELQKKLNFSTQEYDLFSGVCQKHGVNLVPINS